MATRPRTDSDDSEDDGPVATVSPRKQRPRGGSAIRSPPRHFESDHVPFEKQLDTLLAEASSPRQSEPGFVPSSSLAAEAAASSSDSGAPAPKRQSMTAEMEDTLAAIIHAYFDDAASTPTKTKSSKSKPSDGESSDPLDGDLLAPSVDRSQLARVPVLVPQRRWTSQALSRLDVHKKAFLSINISHVMTPFTPSCLHTGQTAAEALTQLADENFLSAPLKNADGLILGFVDVVGLTALLVANETFGDTPQMLPTENLGELVRRNWLTVNSPGLLRVDDSLYTAMEAMCKGAHRLLVVDPADQHVVGIITQSDVVQLLNRFPILLGFKATETLEQNRAYTSDPETVPDSASTLQAIGHIQTSKIGAVAVVSPKGYLTGCFSANSIKGLKDAEISSLHQSVAAYLRQNPAVHHFQHCPPSWTLFQAIHLLAETRAHRLWITEERTGGKLRILGVLTLADVFKSLLSFDQAAAAAQ